MPVGAELAPDGGVHFRVWAPKRSSVDLILLGNEHGSDLVAPLQRNGEYFEAVVRDASAGSRYRFRLDGGDTFPDPVSRFQPDGPHGPSEVVDPSTFTWTDDTWPGP